MRRIEWDDSFLLGFHDADAHHRHLVGLLAKTHDEFVAGVPNLAPVLDKLVDYARYHFKAEELWMMDGLYPGIVGHKREHACFLQIVLRIRKDFLGGNEYLSLDTLQFLHTWITGHILKTDAEFGRFLMGVSATRV
jgi:hemerythrin